MKETCIKLLPLARRHLGTGEGNQKSAGFVFGQALDLQAHDPHEACLRLLRSLNYSVGINHHDYVAAFRLVFGAEAKVVSA